MRSGGQHRLNGTQSAYHIGEQGMLCVLRLERRILVDELDGRCWHTDTGQSGAALRHGHEHGDHAARRLLRSHQQRSEHHRASEKRI